VLRACRRILRPEGRLAFTVIELTPGLSPAQRRAAGSLAPRAVGTRRPYGAMLESAGFGDIGWRDVTADYLATVHAWLAASEPRFDELVAVDGEAVVLDRFDRWRAAITGVEGGLLRRTMYWATRK
jgi:hypothetical protein